MRARSPVVLLLACITLVSAGCQKSKRYSTTMEIVQIRRIGHDPKAQMVDLELKFDNCPADARKIMRGDKAFGSCAANWNKGDKLPAEVVLSYASDRGTYRNELIRLGNCPVKLDPKEDANYEIVQECKDVRATGAVVGVRCDRSRSPALLAKCPWLRRR